jgi:hypothetical protein
MPKSEKIIHVCSVACPNCKQNVDIFKKVKVIAPAEKAVKEEIFYAAKGMQTTLDEASE